MCRQSSQYSRDWKRTSNQPSISIAHSIAESSPSRMSAHGRFLPVTTGRNRPTAAIRVTKLSFASPAPESCAVSNNVSTMQAAHMADARSLQRLTRSSRAPRPPSRTYSSSVAVINTTGTNLTGDKGMSSSRVGKSGPGAPSKTPVESSSVTKSLGS